MTDDHRGEGDHAGDLHHATGTAAAPLTRTIRSTLDRLRAFDRRRPRVWDAAVTAFWAVAAVLDYTSGGWRTVARDVTAPEPLVLLMSLWSCGSRSRCCGAARTR